MTLVVVAVVSALVSAALWRLGRTMFAAPVLARTNHRGVEVPVGAGVVLVSAAIAVEAGLGVAGVLGRTASGAERGGRFLVLGVACGFALLGTFDDLAAHGSERGFVGHVSAMCRGRLTTGGLKLAAGGLLGVVAAVQAGATTLLDLFLGALVVALAANLANLFDRAPGRCTKVALLAGVALVAAASSVERAGLAGVVIILGAGAGLLWFDLREELMLGDAGSNVLGGVLGLGVVVTTARLTQVMVLVVLVGLNVASEAVSFSRVIDATPPLRLLDRLGRRPVESGRTS